MPSRLRDAGAVPARGAKRPRGGERRRWPGLRALHTIVCDFDGVFTDNKVYLDETGRELVRCDRGDGLAIDLLRRYCARRGLNVAVVILSTERNPVVAARARKLGVECWQGLEDKLTFVQHYLARTYPHLPDPFGGLLYLGNDLNDLPVLLRAGFSVVPADAHPKVRQAASAVLPQRGGEGFVRAVVEKFLMVETMTEEEIHGLVSDR